MKKNYLFYTLLIFFNIQCIEQSNDVTVNTVHYIDKITVVSVHVDAFFGNSENISEVRCTDGTTFLIKGFVPYWTHDMQIALQKHSNLYKSDWAFIDKKWYEIRYKQ